MVVSLCGAPLADQSYNLNKLLGLFEAPPALALTCLAGLALLGLRRLLKHAYDNKFGECGVIGRRGSAHVDGFRAGWAGLGIDFGGSLCWLACLLGGPGNFVGLGYLALAAGLIAGWSGALSKAIVELVCGQLRSEVAVPRAL